MSRTHPGEILNEEFLLPLDLSARQLATAIGVPNRISDLVRQRRSMSADTAIRLGRYFGTEVVKPPSVVKHLLPNSADLATQHLFQASLD